MGTRNVARGYKKPGEFNGVKFIATVKSLKFTTSGDLEAVFTIPYEYRDAGTHLADAWGLELRFELNKVVYEKKGEDSAVA